MVWHLAVACGGVWMVFEDSSLSALLSPPPMASPFFASPSQSLRDSFVVFCGRGSPNRHLSGIGC